MNGKKLGSTFASTYCNTLDIDVDWLLWGKGNALVAHKPVKEQDTFFLIWHINMLVDLEALLF